jgi:hypothetical protein
MAMANALPAFPFPEEAIQAQAQGNVNVMILGSLAYAKSLGHDSRHWAAFMGAAFAPGWTGITTAREAATALALNCATTGMQVQSVEGDDARGEVVTSTWPDQELLGMFGLSPAEVDGFWWIFEPIAKSLGLTYSWRREENGLRFTFTR